MSNLHTMTPPLSPRPGAAVLLDPDDFYRLRESWAAIRASTEPGLGRFDPVESLRRTGALITAVEHVITNAQLLDTRELSQAS